uniref:Uncharacterized protein n=1 Tax=Plectus sambesii TaxID=2011161 RepID=A0A914VZ15_9BILA
MAMLLSIFLFALYASAYSIPYSRLKSPQAELEPKESVKFMWNKDEVEICVSLVGQLCWYCPCAAGLKCSMNVCISDSDNTLPHA